MDSKEEVKRVEEQETAAAANGEAEVNQENNQEVEENQGEEEPEEAKETENDGSNPSAPQPSIKGASPGKIFVGGLPKDTTDEGFTKHFEKYGNIVDSVIMKHRGTGHPRGFGFITFEDPAAVDAVIVDTHVFDGKQVEIKRTIPKGAISGKDFRTKKIFVGGIPSTVNDDELKSFFAKFGEIEEHQIMRDHTSGRSRGFGFVSFSTEKAVDDLLTKGNKIEFAGAQVEIKKAEPKKPGNAPALAQPAKHFSNPRPPSAFGRGFKNTYGAVPLAGAEPGPYRYGGGSFGSRPRGYGGYGGPEYNSGYGGGYGGAEIGSYRGESSLGLSSRYGAGLGRGYGLGGYNEPGETYGRYGGAAGYGSGYESGPGVGGYAGVGGYGSGGPGTYGARRDYGGGPSGRYHPYSR